jgi:4-amino-4-deoxy-L-arabinose transferase-like glycosyltransferase
MSSLIDIGNLLIVLSACSLSLIVPTLRTALWLSEEKSWPHILLLALVLGLTSQGILGFFWNHYLRIGVSLEIILYFLGWLIATAIVVIRQRKQKLFQRLSISREDFILIGLLILAVAVRSIHPLQHMALGQSDAYSHLQFLRNVVDSGFVHNVMYPPGYHWILALPTTAFHLDPYHVARYGGAFFGAGLVLAIYVLVKSIADNPAAILSAFLVSCFPGLYFLLKTGVGAFANQLGLFFIPVVFYFYIITEEEKFGKSPMAHTLLALSLMGLSISVPMMLIHVLLILCIIRMLLFIKRRDKWLLQTGIFALSVLPAIILLSLHLLHAGPVHQQETIKVITAAASIKSVPSLPGETSEGISQFPLPDPTRHLKTVFNHPAMNLLFDFFSGKRWGVGHFAANTTGFLILIISGISILWGFKGGGMGWTVLGFWGVIASLQTMTGFLQFSGYQRAGWSLMIVAACLSGIIGGAICRWGKRWVIFRVALVIAVLLSISGSFVYPPVHELRASFAEDEIIQVARDVSYRYIENRYWSIAEKPIENDPGYLSAFSSRLPLTIMTRKMTGWHDYNQGELVPSVIHPSEKVQVMTISSGADGKDLFEKSRQYLVFIDQKTEGCNRNKVFFSMIDPRQVKSYIDGCESYYKINESIGSSLNTLNPDKWQIMKSVIGPNLTVIAVTPKKKIS